MNKFNLLIILIIIISIFVLYKHTYTTLEKFESTPTTDQVADAQEQQEQQDTQAKKDETAENSRDISKTSAYVETINNILTDRIDVVDSKLSTRLKDFETNEINFHTIPDEKGSPGSMNICNTRNNKTICSHLAYKDGSTYIRPGVENADIWLNKAKDINIVAQNINEQANNVNIVGKTSTNICTSTACSHFPWSGDNNTYIRSGTWNNDIQLGEARNINFQANKVIFKNKNGSGAVEITADDMKKMKATANAPIAVTASIPVIQTGRDTRAKTMRQAYVQFDKAFVNEPNVNVTLDDNGSSPSTYQIMGVSRQGFTWYTEKMGTGNRTVRWIAVST